VPQTLNKSVIALFDEQSLSLRIDAIRREVARRFGGGSALELPVHLTLFKWTSDDLPSALVASISQCRLEARIVLGELTLSTAHRAVWLDVSPLQQGDLYDCAERCLDAHGITADRLRPSPHLTIAYENYDDRQLVEILAWVRSRSEGLSGRLTVGRLGVASADSDGVWRLLDP
jgi:hypothetical protein